MGFKGMFTANLGPKRVLPPGAGYRLRIAAVSEHAFSTGTQGIKAEFDIEGAPAGCEAAVGTNVSECFPIEGRGVAFLAPFLRALGVTPDDDGNVRFDTDSLLGRVVTADFVEEAFEGETRIRIRKFRKP
jgi:hypothetical protein